MRLDPERELAPGTVAAIQDLLASRELPTMDDSAFLAVALGVADAPTRLACARAILANPSVRGRLLSIRASVSGSLGVPTPGLQDSEDLGRLSAFVAPFDGAAARAVFPARFGEGLRLDRLAEGGWLESADSLRGPVYQIPDRFRADEVTLEPEETDRFVQHFAESARWIDRCLAEGQWAEAIEVLRRTLPDLRAAWRFADATRDFDAVATFVDTLAAELMESGEWDALTDLAAVGSRASDALDRPGLRSKLLSYEGAAAARRGDSARAIVLWSARVELNRKIGNAVAEADALLDLAAESGERENESAWRHWDRLAERATERADRADLSATLWTVRAEMRLKAKDSEGAAAYAKRALDLFAGNLGIDSGLFVRLGAAKILGESGCPEQAVRGVAELLAIASEATRPAQVAMILTSLADLLEPEGQMVLAERCLRLALAIYRAQGARRVVLAEIKLAEFLDRHQRSNMGESDFSEWETAVQDVLAELREGHLGSVHA